MLIKQQNNKNDTYLKKRLVFICLLVIVFLCILIAILHESSALDFIWDSKRCIDQMDSPSIDDGETLSEFISNNPGEFPFFEQYEIPELPPQFIIDDVTSNGTRDRATFSVDRRQIQITIFDYEYGSYGVDTEDATVNQLLINGYEAFTVEKYYNEEQLNTNRVILLDKDYNLLIDVFGMRVELPFLMEIAEGIKRI